MLSTLSLITILIVSIINLLPVISAPHIISKTTFPSNPLFLQFSKNQKYLACGSEGQVDIYNGLTLDHVQTFTLEQGNVLKGLDFSLEEDRIVFGFESNNGDAYEQEEINGNRKMQQNSLKQNDMDLTVTGICYSANSSNIFVGIQQNLIHLHQQNQISNFDIQHTVIKIACSPNTPELIAIITTNKIIVYSIDTKNSTIVKVYQQEFTTTPSDLSFSDQNFCVSVDNTVYLYQTQNFSTLEKYTFPNHKLHNVVVAKNILGVSEQNYVNLQNINDQHSERVPNVGTIFAVADNGYNLLIMSSQKQANLYIRCPQDYYFDLSISTCVSCSDKKYCFSCRQKEKCQACLNSYVVNSQGVCSCPSGKYDLNNTCQLCPYQCKDCTSEETCQSCSDTFTKSGDRCICPEGFELKGNSCTKEQGTNILLIVLLIFAGVVVIGGIIGFIVFKLRRKAKKGLLEDDEDEVDEKVKA